MIFENILFLPRNDLKKKRERVEDRGKKRSVE
jgi:hypothetical protein